MNKKVIVIGAGISGLTAGIYLKKSGFDVTILEQHTIPGGMCTSWKRKGYLFEGAMHWLNGSSKKTNLNKLWREVGAIDDTTKIRYDDIFRTLEYNGKLSYLYRDLDKLKQHFNEISPQDINQTDQLIKDIIAFSAMQAPVTNVKGVKCNPREKSSFFSTLKMIKTFPTMKRLLNVSVGEYINQFKSPEIRLLLSSIVPDEYSVISIIFTLATLYSGDGGYLEGGSLAMTQRMADKFTSLGGKIQYNTKVDKIKTNATKAIGVTVNNKLIPSDHVIVTQEIIAASQQLFEQPPKDKWIENIKKTTKPSACCFVCLGIKAELKQTPIFVLPKPITCGGFEYNTLSFNNYYDYKGYAPKGSTALTIFLGGDSYDYWKAAKEDGTYQQKKQDVADQITNALLTKYENLHGKIEVIDIATPLTYERYTSASKGSWMSVMEKGAPSMSPAPCTLEKIENVFFAGHRTMSPGGMPVALTSGRTAAQLICKKESQTFNSI